MEPCRGVVWSREESESDEEYLQRNAGAILEEEFQRIEEEERQREDEDVRENHAEGEEEDPMLMVNRR